MRRRFAIALAFTALAATGASAQQPVYRCGSTYSAQPCEGGYVVGAAHTPSADEAARARAVAKTDARLADQMERARLAQEARAPKAIILGESGTKVREPAREKPGEEKPRLQKPGKFQHFTAMQPRPVSTAAPKKKAKSRD